MSMVGLLFFLINYGLPFSLLVECSPVALAVD